MFRRPARCRKASHFRLGTGAPRSAQDVEGYKTGGSTVSTVSARVGQLRSVSPTTWHVLAYHAGIVRKWHHHIVALAIGKQVINPELGQRPPNKSCAVPELS